jgi:hypothetical protein
VSIVVLLDEREPSWREGERPEARSGCSAEVRPDREVDRGSDRQHRQQCQHQRRHGIDVSSDRAPFLRRLAALIEEQHCVDGDEDRERESARYHRSPVKEQGPPLAGRPATHRRDHRRHALRQRGLNALEFQEREDRPIPGAPDIVEPIDPRNRLSERVEFQAALQEPRRAAPRRSSMTPATQAPTRLTLALPARSLAKRRASASNSSRSSSRQSVATCCPGPGFRLHRAPPPRRAPTPQSTVTQRRPCPLATC